MTPPNPETQKSHTCHRCRAKYSTDKEEYYNRMRSEIFIHDSIQGKRTITIAKTTDSKIQEISSWKEGMTYDDIILMCINSYHKERENNSSSKDKLEQIAALSDNEE